MRTALDTNVISALWSGEPTATAVSEIMNAARMEGSLVVCGAVYAELLAHPKVQPSFVDEFLISGRISVDTNLDASVWREAGLAFAAYAARRRAGGTGQTRRLLVDYVVGSHAFLKADRLFTFDKTRYYQDFPKLQIVTP